MKRVAASVLDALAAALLVFLAFRIGLAVAPCDELSECYPLTPIIVLLALVLLAGYFLVSHRFWGRSPAQRLLNVAPGDGEDEI